MALPVTLIESTDTLESGFRAKSNSNFNSIVVDGEVDADGNLLLHSTNGDIEVPLSEYFASKGYASGVASTPPASETVSGRARIATDAEAILGVNDSTFITPLKLLQKLEDYFSKSIHLADASAEIQIGNNSSITKLLGSVLLQNTDGFSAKFDVSLLSANHIVTYPDRDIIVNDYNYIVNAPNLGESWETNWLLKNNEPNLFIGNGDDAISIILGKTTSNIIAKGSFRLGSADEGNMIFSVPSLNDDITVSFPSFAIAVNDWNSLYNKPTSFNPSFHFHEIGDITGLSSALGNKQDKNDILTALTGLTGNGIVRKTGTSSFSIGTNDLITLSGDVTGTGTTAITTTLANSGVTAGTYRSVTVDAKGRVTNGTNPTTIAGYGITDFNSNFDARWNTTKAAYVYFGSAVEVTQNLTVNEDFYVYGSFYDNSLESGSNNQFLRADGLGGFFWSSLSTTQISNFSANVLGQVLTDIGAGSNTPIDSSNTILTGFQNLQAQVSAKANALSGTVGFLPKFTSSTTLGDSYIYDNGTQIGVGTIYPESKLGVLSPTAGNTSEYLQKWIWNKDIFWLGLKQKHINGSHIQWSFDDANGVLMSFKLGKIGFGTEDPTFQTHVYGAGQNDYFGFVDALPKGASLYLQDSNGSAYSGGSVVFGASQGYYAAIKGLLRDGSNNTKGDLDFQTRANNTDASLTSRIFIQNDGKVGVNNQFPTYQLDVEGTGRFAGAVQFDSIPSCSISPTSANHLVNKSFVESLSFLKRGESVKTISFTTLTKSGLYAVNGYTLLEGDLVLDAGNTSGGGVWVASAGSWSRSTLNDSDTEIRGAYHYITNGTYANSRYINTNTSTITVGTTSITYDVDFGAETDPVWNAYKTANDLTPTRFGNWNTAYGWGNHANLYVDKVSTQSDIGGAKTFTNSIQSPIVVAGTNSLNITFSNFSGTSPRMSSNGTLDFLATTQFSWLTSGNIGRMRLTTTGLRVGSTTNPSYMLHVSGTTGFEGLISLGNPSQNIAMSSGTAGQFMRRSLVSNGFYNVDVNNWANITVADISDIATYYQAKITGTENYLTKKTESNFGDSQIFDNGTSVVIGGTSSIDSSKFSVIGKIGATTARIGDDTNGINIGSLAINSTGALGYGATSHVWDVSATEKMSLNGSRLALTGDFELTGKFKVNGSYGEDHFFLKTLGVDGGGNPLGTEWAVLNCGEISDIANLYLSLENSENYALKVDAVLYGTFEGERGFKLFHDAEKTDTAALFFANQDTGTVGIHYYGLDSSDAVTQHGIQISGDGFVYHKKLNGSKARFLTTDDSLSGGGTWNGGTVSNPIMLTQTSAINLQYPNFPSLASINTFQKSTQTDPYLRIRSQKEIGIEATTALNLSGSEVAINNVVFDTSNVAGLVGQDAKLRITNLGSGRYKATIVAI